MKKLFTLLLLVPLFVACEKDPDTSKLDYDFVVYTSHDDSTDFAKSKTYYVADSILVINDKKDPEYLVGSDAAPIIKSIVENMNAKGYTQTSVKADADLGIQSSYVKNTYYLMGYAGSNWWWGYPGYWGSGYWGPGYGGGWYYPYPVTYGYQVGALLIEMVGLKDAANREDQKLPIVWNTYITGLLSGSNKINTQLAVNAIDQAFEQSPYLTTK